MNNPDIAEHGEKTRFKPGKSGNPKGRKPSILKKLIKEHNLSKQDIDAILTSVSIMPIEELYKKRDSLNPKGGSFNGKISAIEAALVAGMTRDISRGSNYITNSILDRVYGKARESVEHTGGLDISIGKPPLPEDAYSD